MTLNVLGIFTGSVNLELQPTYMYAIRDLRTILWNCCTRGYWNASLHYTLAAEQCIVISPVCLWLGVCVCVGGSVTTITRNCVHQSSPNWVLWVKVMTISSWLHFGCHAPGKGVCGGVKIFGSALLQPACSVCVLSERFFYLSSGNSFFQPWKVSETVVKWSVQAML